MGWRLSSGILLAFISHASASEPDRELAACAAQKNSVERLACFDKLATDRDVAAPKTDLSVQGSWDVVTETSKIDDSTNVRLSVESFNSFPDRLSRDTKATLIIDCREKQTHFFVYLGGLFLSDNAGFGEVTYRIDKNTAQTIGLTESTNHEALGLWSGAGVRFLKELFGAQHLLLRVTPYSESAVTVEFNVSGLEDAIKPLRKACAW